MSIIFKGVGLGEHQDKGVGLGEQGVGVGLGEHHI